MKLLLQILLLRDFNILGKIAIFLFLGTAIDDYINYQRSVYFYILGIFILWVRFACWTFLDKDDGDKHGLY